MTHDANFSHAGGGATPFNPTGLPRTASRHRYTQATHTAVERLAWSLLESSGHAVCVFLMHTQQRAQRVLV